jgi:hypothetical protein
MQPEMLDLEVFGLERDLLFDDELRERVEIIRNNSCANSTRLQYE